VLINTPTGDLPGDRGLAAVPGRETEFRAGLEQALTYAEALSCPRIHVMAGVLPPGTPRNAAQDTYLSNLAWAARQAAGRMLLIEPINPRDVPGYFLNRQDEAHAAIHLVGADNLRVQMDLYHCQIVEGDLEMRLRQHLPEGRLGHLQIAGVPHRHEPDTGEVDYRYLFGVIDALGWDGWVGCEYRPRAGTSEGLGWMKTMCA
jgi:2-dehydrotetronate isomerase